MRKLIIAFALLMPCFSMQINASKYPALGVAGLGCAVAAVYYGLSAVFQEPKVSEKMSERRKQSDLIVKKLNNALAIKRAVLQIGDSHSIDERRQKRYHEGMQSLKDNAKDVPDILALANTFSDHFSRMRCGDIIEDSSRLQCRTLQSIQAQINQRADDLEKEATSADLENEVEKALAQKIKTEKKQSFIKFLSFSGLSATLLWFYARTNATSK